MVVNMPTTTCACWELPDLPKLETSAVSESAGPLWPGSVRNEKKLEKWKSGKLETKQKHLLWRGKWIGILFCSSSYTNIWFLYAKRVVCVLKTWKTSHDHISFCLHSNSGMTDPTLMCVAYVGFLGIFLTLLMSETQSECNITCWRYCWVRWEGSGVKLSQSGQYCRPGRSCRILGDVVVLCGIPWLAGGILGCPWVLLGEG